MTHAAVYVSTANRGATLRALRLMVGERDETWTAPDLPSSRQDDGPPEFERSAADWLRTRLAEDRRTKDRIASMVVDGTGSMFAWSDIPQGVDAATVAESIRRVGAAPSDPMAGDADHTSPLASAPELELPEGLTLEPLDDPSAEADAVRRVAIGATPDLATRLLLDRLDSMRISTASVMSIWQAVGLAWNSPSTQASAPASADIVDAPASASTLGAVVIDAPGRRLLWTWTRNRKTLACGSCRLARDGSAPSWVFSRLCAEWLAWSSQLGVTPGRITVVQNQSLATTEQATPRPAALLAQHWPQCTVDAIELDDPMLATLARAADRLEGDPDPVAQSQHLRALTERPGRLHRSSRRWIALAMLACAAAMALGAWQLSSAATGADSMASEARTLWRDRAAAIDARCLEPGVLDPILYLEDLLAERRREVAPVARRRPVMTELESVSLVIGYDGVQLEELYFSQIAAIIRLRVDSTQEYEDLNAALSSIAGSEIRDWLVSPQTVGNKIQAIFRGTWGRTGPDDNAP